MKRAMTLLIILAVLLPTVPAAGAAREGWTRVGDMLAERLSVTRDAQGALQVWTAESAGFSVFREDGSLAGRFRWPVSEYGYAGAWTYQVAAAPNGTLWTIGGCCPAKSMPTLDVMAPAADRTRAVSITAAFDVGRIGNQPIAIEVDGRGRPWLAVGNPFSYRYPDTRARSAVWMMSRGSETPLDVSDDAWIEITDATGTRLGPIMDLAPGPDGAMWLLGPRADRAVALLRFDAGDAPRLTAEYTVPPTIVEPQRLAVGSDGAIYLGAQGRLWRLSHEAEPQLVVDWSTFGGAVWDAAAVGDTLWVATDQGTFRRSTTPTPARESITFGPVENVGNYSVPVAEL